MEARFPVSKRVTAEAIDWYKVATRKRTFDLSEKRPGWSGIRARAAEPGNPYVGSDACRGCHEYQYKKWKSAQHGSAMESLAEAGYDRSPECVVCHVVGYGAEDGFRSMTKTPTLGTVGCEACHGRGHLHLKEPEKYKLKTRGPAACRACHTPKHHPGFLFSKHYPRVDHRQPGKPPGETNGKEKP
jgi:hypothetical protein